MSEPKSVRLDQNRTGRIRLSAHGIRDTWPGRGRGADPDFAAANCFSLRKASIYAGSNEIQRNIMAKAVLGLGAAESRLHIRQFSFAQKIQPFIDSVTLLS